MERSYEVNLLFSNVKERPINDTEKGSWARYRYDELITSDWRTSLSLDFSHNTMVVRKSGYHLRNFSTINFSDTSTFTLSFKYKIDQEYLYQALILNKEIPTLKWSNGEIIILKRKDDNTFIQVSIDNKVFLIPIDYSKINDWIRLLMSYDRSTLRIFINGMKKIEKIMNVSYKFNDIKFGNYGIDEENNLEGPIVDYDELVLVNDCLYNKDFLNPFYRIHDLFPEINIDKKETQTIKRGKAKAPFFYLDTESKMDKINSIDITRRKDLAEPITNPKDKYNYDLEYKAFYM